MNIQWIKALRFHEIRYDQWRRLVGVLSTSEQRGLRKRERLHSLLQGLRSLARLPISLLRAIDSLVRLLTELERLHFSQRRKVRCGLDCVIDCQTWLMNGENIRLGDFVKVSAFSTIMAGEHATVEIGTNTILGPGVVVVAFNHGTELNGVPIRYQRYRDEVSGSIVIADDVWIGANAVILPGTRIGAGSIVGAGTVLRGTVPPGTLVYGDLKDRIRMVPRH
jgi:acetyltransferase-like isoleucine patch superfamily enzyme